MTFRIASMTFRIGKIALWTLYAIFWLGGVITGGNAPDAPWTAPAFLLLAGALAFRKELLPAALIGFTAELIGVHTGFPFGHYTYTGALGPKIAGVPIAIAASWLILTDLAMWGRHFRVPALILIVWADLVIDPVAAGPLNYWIWATPGAYYGIPISNYAGWLIVTAIILALAPPAKSNRPPYVALTVIAFFTALATRYRLWIPAAAGAILTLSLARLGHRLLETSSRTIRASE